jgi:hypothetical protein
METLKEKKNQLRNLKRSLRQKARYKWSWECYNINQTIKTLQKEITQTEQQNATGKI